MKKALKKLTIVALLLTMALGVFTLSGCGKEGKMVLKQGIYATDDNIASINLYGDNLFSFSIMYLSYLPTGSYCIKNDKLVLNYSDNYELIFDIGDDQITFTGAYEGGLVAEGPVQTGIVFKRTFVEIQTDDMIELNTWYFTSGIPNNAIKVKHTDENAVFECTVDKGTFWDYSQQQFCQNALLKSNDTIYWNPEQSASGTARAYVEILLKIDDNIIGYAVVEISQNGSPIDHTATILKSVLFPKIDGEYQNIAKEQIKATIEEIKNK